MNKPFTITSPRRRRAFLGLAALTTFGVAGLGGLGCDDAPDSTLLTPTGEAAGTAELRGVVAGLGVGEVATIYALRDYVPGYMTTTSTIHPTGSWNEWSTTHWSEPGMRYLGGGAWVDTRDLSSGEITWKFVVGRAWGDDYVNAGGGDGLVGTTERGSGTGNDMRADVLESGLYNILLYEGTTPPSYRIEPMDEAPVTTSRSGTGTFSIPNLPAGTYEVVIIAEGFVDRHVSGVVITDGGSADLETITLVDAEFGTVAGTVTFDDDPAELPTATVRVTAGTGTIEGTTDAAGAFVIEDVPVGTVGVEISAAGYVSQTITDVEVTAETTTTLDPITLLVDEACQTSSAIEIVGEFNGWPPPPGGPHMTLVDPSQCVWADTLTISVDADSVWVLKFRTNEAWDDDYGTCTSEDDIHEFVGGVTSGDACIVSGEGTGLSIKFPGDGDYRFELDERRSTWRISTIE